MRLDADRPDAGAAAAVRDAECLVQVHVADVGADVGGARDRHLRVEVGAVHIDLSAARVDDGADLPDAALEHAVGGGIGDHQRRQPVGVRVGLGGKVGDVDVAARVALDHHHLQPGHHGGGGVGAMGGGRDQADVARALAAGFVPAADRQQPGVFALTAGVGLQRHRVKAGDRAELRLQFREQAAIAARMPGGREGVDVGKTRPGDRDHLRRGVQLHGAGAERDHRAVERDVLGLQAAQIAQHLRLGAAAVKHRMAQIAGAAAQTLGRRRRNRGVQRRDRSLDAKRRPQRLDVGAGGGLVETGAQPVGVDAAQQQPRRLRPVGDRGRAARRADGQRVEEGVRRQREAAPAQPLGGDGGEPRRALRDALQPLRPVIHRIHRRHHRQQRLRGADVGCRLVAANVLFAGLQRHAQRGGAVAVHRDADDAPRRAALVRVAGGEKRRVRAAETHRHAEPLRRADGDIGAQLPRRGQQRQRQQVGRHHRQRARAVQLVDHPAPVAHRAGRAGIAEERAEHRRGVERRGVSHHDLDALRPRAGAQHGDGLRMGVGVHEKGVRLRRRHAVRHGHRLGGGGGLVQQRGVGEIKAGEVHHHLLIGQQRLKPPLADLGLIGGVAGVPARILQHVAQDHRRRDGPVIAHADHRAGDHVLVGHAAQVRQRLRFGHRRFQRQRRPQADRLGHGLIQQRVQRGGADGLEHVRLLGGVGAVVAAGEGARVLQRLQRRAQVKAERRRAGAQRIGIGHGVRLRSGRHRRRGPSARPARTGR